MNPSPKKRKAFGFDQESDKENLPGNTIEHHEEYPPYHKLMQQLEKTVERVLERVSERQTQKLEKRLDRINDDLEIVKKGVDKIQTELKQLRKEMDQTGQLVGTKAD